MAVGSLSLWVASPGVLSQPPASLGLQHGPPLPGAGALWDASLGDLSQLPLSKIGLWVVALYSLTAWVQHLLRD